MKETAWFESWFDSPFYRLLYGHRDNQEAKIFLQNLIQAKIIGDSSVILDAGCGYGRHACWLAQQNLQVTGIDLATQRIIEAKMYAKSLPNPPDFQVQDMRIMPFQNQFDVVLNLFTSFGYFSDIGENQRVLLKFWEALKANGKLVLDYLNAAVVPKKQEIKELLANGVLFCIEKNNYETYVEKKIQIFPPQQEPQEFVEKVTLFSAEELINMIEVSGFQLVTVFGNYNLDTFEADSPRTIIVAKCVKS